VLAPLAALALTAAPAASAAGDNYVALGDSYSSGVGASPYIADGTTCQRSVRSYTQLWANTHAPASYKSVACGGATTVDVTNKQLSALSSSTTLVSMGIGGNDVGFSSVMTTCVTQGTTACVAAVNAAEAQANSILPGRLDALYTAIKGRSPAARVVSLGYPHFYDTSGWFCVGLSDTSRNKINEGADVLDGLIQAASSRNGVSFADVRSRFAADHLICDGSSSWLHSVEYTEVSSSYHPNAAGYSGGYLPAFTAAAG